MLRSALFALLTVPACLLVAQAPGTLTLDLIAHPTKRLQPPAQPSLQASWLPDGTLLETTIEGGKSTYVRRDAKKLSPLPYDAQEAEKAKSLYLPLLQGLGVDEKAAQEAVKRMTLPEKPGPLLLKAGETLMLVDTAAKTVKKLGETKVLDQALLSPDGRRVAFLKGNDIHLLDVATLEMKALTTGGSDKLLNGRLDWVTQEEVYGRGTWRAFWWAPDSTRLAFLSLDVAKAPTFRMTDDRFQPQRNEDLSYPKAGEPNPITRLGMVDLQGAVSWMQNPHPEEETLIVDVTFDPKGQLLATWQNRIQNWMELHRYAGDRATLLVREHNPKGWVERPKPLRFLADGSFLLQSERSGHEHLYLHASDGRELRALTQGDFQVRRVLAVDEKAGRIFLEANKDNAIGADAYLADLKGKAPLRRLTTGGGTHRVQVDPTFTWLIDSWSSVASAGQTVLRNLQGQIVKVLEDRTGRAPAYRRGTVKLVQVPTRDGYLMDAELILPPDFDPAKKYPVFQTGYAGPASPTVRDRWAEGGFTSPLWEHFLAQQGYIVWKCDPRCAADKGMVLTQTCYRNLGAQELKDYEDGLTWLAKQGYADMSRVAIDGWSYGGYMAAYCATNSTKWKVAIVGAPVTDYRLYDSIYTERFMALPKDNPEGYDATSTIKKAKDTQSKLLILHGMMDENVHPQNSVMLMNALMEAGKDFQFVAFPGAGHGPRGPWQNYHRLKQVWDFLQKNL